MTKEEIQVQIEIIDDILDRFHESSDVYQYYYHKSEELKKLNTKSIKDLQKEAFEAGRCQKKVDNWECENPADWYYFKYNTFEDYLKSKENEK